MLYLCSFLLCTGLTYLIRRYTLAKGVLDIPNARSSHQAPTPRGGGAAIVVTCLGAFTYLIASGQAPVDMYGVVAACALVAGVGFVDDHQDVSARFRFLIQTIAASMVVYFSGGLPSLEVMGHLIDLGIPGDLLTVLGLVWLINLTNFMDGINGIATCHLITTTLLMAAFLLMSMELNWLAQMLFVSAFSGLGFLFWNFPKAKIFMGDVGSGFIGVFLGALLLLAAHENIKLFWMGLILMGCFIVDATFTLIRRFVKKENVFTAHRSHTYQRAADLFGSHTPVTLGLILISLLWLAPIAICVSMGVLDGAVGALTAYCPLVILAFNFVKHDSKSDA